MATSTVEDYVKRLYLLQQQSSRKLVPVGELASAMRVVPGTATTMVKALADGGLVDYAPRTGVRLSRNGQQLALHVLRRHRLIELFLVETLRLDWLEVHHEAETLEHAVSDKVLAAIDRMLGFPETDPHGDPIPSAQGKLTTSPETALADCVPGKRRLRVSRVVDQTPQFLQFVERCGLMPGSAARVLERDPAADSVRVESAKGETVTLGLAAAGKIYVES